MFKIRYKISDENLLVIEPKNFVRFSIRGVQAKYIEALKILVIINI